MTREQAREAAAVMLGWADGKELQCAVRRRQPWTWELAVTSQELGFDWNVYTYRLKPTSVIRPWTADEVPLGAQCRTKGDSKRFLIVRTSDESTREEWLNKCEHSTDGGKTWKPCGVEEVKP
jgi:hypothetical protein